MLSQQFLASASRLEHPSHGVVLQQSGPRCQKPTLQNKFFDKIRPLLSGNVLPAQNYSTALKAIHTSSVSESVQELAANRVLNASPPLIDKSEASLPRKYRTTLAQLRSGHCNGLTSFHKLIGKTLDDSCPVCGVIPHDVAHVFSCTSHPTALVPTDLWRRPKEVASLLSSLPRAPSFWNNSPVIYMFPHPQLAVIGRCH